MTSGRPAVRAYASAKGFVRQAEGIGTPTLGRVHRLVGSCEGRVHRPARWQRRPACGTAHSRLTAVWEDDLHPGKVHGDLRERLDMGRIDDDGELIATKTGHLATRYGVGELRADAAQDGVRAPEPG